MVARREKRRGVLTGIVGARIVVITRFAEGSFTQNGRIWSDFTQNGREWG